MMEKRRLAWPPLTAGKPQRRTPMKIIYSGDITESAPGARVAQHLAQRVGATVARLQLAGDRLSHSPSGATHQSTYDGTPSEDAADTRLTYVATESAPSPASTRLIVASGPSRGTAEDADAAERLALTTRVPTLVVHEPARILTWLSGKRTLRVLCAHDLTSVADEALRFVRQLMKIGRCEITLAHVHRSVEQMSHPGCRGVGSMRKRDLEMRSLLDGKLQERARTILGDETVATRVSPAPFRRDDFILDAIRDTSPDLVVAPVHPYAEAGASLAAATSRTLLCFAEANLVIVPPTFISAAQPKHVVNRVLVVADLLTTDAGVVAQARALLGPGGTLRVVHVLHPHAVQDTDQERVFSFRQRMASHLRLVDSSSFRLRALARNEAHASGTSVESELVEHRDRALAIAHAAERFDADVVCLAHVKRPTFLERLFGSQLWRILTKAKRSLLIVQHTPA